MSSMDNTRAGDPSNRMHGFSAGTVGVCLGAPKISELSSGKGELKQKGWSEMKLHPTAAL